MRNFRDLTKGNSIEIPIIQRDYVQGRDDSKVKEIRKSFLDDIFKALSDKKDFHLDFVYGSFIDNKFIPIDGQQRLTTLFLLYWYYTKKENKEFNIKFTYKTRVSSREFCEQLNDFNIDISKAKEYSLREQILDSKEFIPFWENDPTIKSMLIMIDEISRRDKGNITLNDLDRITFEVFKLEDFGKEQSEELYRKMNSRGKALTPFENFKAIIEQIVYADNKEKHKEISIKFERTWIDAFWNNYRDETSNLVDNSFMNYVYFITEMLAYKKGDKVDMREKVQSFSYLKEFYRDKGNLEFLEKALDNFKKIEEVSNVLEKEFIFFEKDTKINLLEEIVEKYINSTITNKILLYLIIEKIDTQEENLKLLMRILRNILYRYRALRRAGSIEYTLNLKYEQIHNLLDNFLKLKNNPYKSILEIEYSDKNFSHEKVKAELLKDSFGLQEKLFKLEDYKYIKGDLRLFFDDEFKFKLLKERIEFISDNIAKIFDENDDLIVRALLSIDDYSLWIGSVNGGSKWFFGQNKKWEIFLTDNLKSHENIALYANFFDEYSKEVSLKKMRENKLNEYNGNKKNWVYYFLKYSIISKSENNFFNVFGWGKEHSEIEKHEKETRITNWHVNIYLLALLNELDLEINDEYIKIDEDTSLSYLMINNKKIVIEDESIVYNGKKYPLFKEDDAVEILKNVLKKNKNIINLPK
jgi:hypothetical protein